MTEKKPGNPRRSRSQILESAERAKYYKQRTIAAEMQNARERGELVPPALLEYALEQIAGRVAAALDALPSQIKTAIPHLRAGEVRLIAELLARTRNGLARTQIDFKDAARRD